MSQDNEGFFKNFHESVSKCVDDVTKNNFANLESNSKRVAYISSLDAVKKFNLKSELEKCQGGVKFPAQKDFAKARQLKDEGNGAVKKGDWAKALQCYSQSLIYMPVKETEDMSIVYANRSAALNHLEQYEETLNDIRRCLQLGYPRHLRYKVMERKARCLLALKRNQEAMRAFQETISSLDDATQFDKEKRIKMLTDSKLMLEILNKGLSMAGNPKDPEAMKRTPPRPKLPGKVNSKYPAASEAIQIDYNETKGRYATATRDISAGEIVLVEKPHSGVLLAEFCKTHCHNCFVRCAIPVPCPNCPNVIFCSDKCKEIALKSYHGYECHLLPIIWKSGCSITCHIALRMITQKDKQYFNKIKEELDAVPEGTYKTENYKNIYHLVSHEDKRTKQDLLQRTEMATFFVKLLATSGYFDGKPRQNPINVEELSEMSVEDKYKDDVAFFGGLLLKNLQVLQFNAHEVFELQCPKPKVGKNVIKHDGKSVFLAGAVFPTLALFNHSCDPGVVRYFCGPTIVVRAVKNLKQGDEVSENYGPIFTTVPKARRRAELKDQYWFDCDCTACTQDWPLYADMNENYMRFKCDSDQPCSNVVAVPHECKEFMVQCGLCYQYTNILKGLKSLQDTDMAFRLGRAAMEEGKYGEAIKKFIEVLQLFDKTLSPPYRSYYDCVQDLRRSMLSLGNYSIV